ncbi:MAG: glycosyltransferase family 4 protein [Hyphomicrobiales bacterium]|nr:glycosyltransferase family 4 protein [Hyphomicrobiales bacterium]
MKIAVVASHPIQYQAPIFRALAERCALQVFFAHRASPAEQGAAGFGGAFDWDVDLTEGYDHSFLRNVAAAPNASRFYGCDTPEIGARLREGRFSAALVMGWHLKTYVQTILSAKMTGLPVMVRGDSQLSTPRSALKRVVKEAAYPPMLRFFDAALYVGARSRAYYEHYRFPAQKLYFAPHCVDNMWFSQRATAAARDELRATLGVAEETTLLLFAGKLAPRKRPLDVIEAAARLRRTGAAVEVMVAGDGELRDALQQAAEATGVRLHMLGFCNQTRMPQAYAACDMLVLPSSGEETWGLVVNEALASGRPVVVSDQCGSAPDLAAPPCGRIFAAGDCDALARAVESLMAHPPQQTDLVELIGRYSVSETVNAIMRAADAIARPNRSVAA